MKYKYFSKFCALLLACSLIMSSFAVSVFAETGTDNLVSGTWTIPEDSSVAKGTNYVFQDTVSADDETHKFQYDFTALSTDKYLVDVTFSLEGKLKTSAHWMLHILDSAGKRLGRIYFTWTGDFYFTHMPDDADVSALCKVDNCGAAASVNSKTQGITGIKLNMIDASDKNSYNIMSNSKYTVRFYVDHVNDYFTVGVKNITRGDTEFTYSTHKTNANDANEVPHPLQFPLNADDVVSGITIDTPKLEADSMLTVYDATVRKCFNPEVTSSSIEPDSENVSVAAPVVFTLDNPITAGLNQIKIYAGDVIQSYVAPPFELSSDKKTLTYTGSLSYATKYKFEITDGAVESDGMFFAPYSLEFTTEQAPENFYDGFKDGALSAYWNPDADKNGVSASLGGGVLKVSPDVATNENITFKPGGNEGEYWVDGRISMKGMLRYSSQPLIRFLGTSKWLGQLYLTWNAAPFVQVNQTAQAVCAECGGNTQYTTANGISIGGMYTGTCTAEAHDTQISEDMFDIRFHVDTDENHFICGMKRAEDANYTYAVHADANGVSHPVKFPIPDGEILTGIEFISPSYSDKAEVREFNIHSASVRKYIRAEIVSSTIERNAIGVPVESSVEYTFEKPILNGFENIKMYENGTELPSSSLELSDDKTTVKLTAPLKYSSEYEIKIPASGVDWNGMLFKEDSFAFSTEHMKLGVTADNVKAIDANGNTITDFAAANASEIKVSANINSSNPQTVTVICVLYKASGGKRIMYDVVSQVCKLNSGLNTFTSAGSLKLPASAADRTGLAMKVYIWDNFEGMRSANTYTQPAGE